MKATNAIRFLYRISRGSYRDVKSGRRLSKRTILKREGRLNRRTLQIKDRRNKIG
jgi:hypothetical protein